MTQHHVGKVKHLLDLQNAIWTPAHVIPCEKSQKINKCIGFKTPVKWAATLEEPDPHPRARCVRLQSYRVQLKSSQDEVTFLNLSVQLFTILRHFPCKRHVKYLLLHWCHIHTLYIDGWTAVSPGCIGSSMQSMDGLFPLPMALSISSLDR